ncbi:Asp-tRNA(Asn)/Glu-tRNA(Gln) amidotransferase subunit GatC [Mycoplasma marinum]|uniref:Asp-tRNA(Asn)/Glu-tRNA(Gln) amidotransferase GatCAB subunit C n=1 Tax=Mycoplasma marinum TaxID=1937190 RepID=A0A4R0XV28_9MOLU|nr:Asp-tRNA(Asn)/Glu-tRNA(Gln) amidotransferase subunit GatC [Mycoplasma marinum]TCG10761.1 Asp-tRNA(Asn)/Glu-tRNA(Gln) amidotransferase GatCAB subunit C [Mycoplasma marinum]
MTKETLKEIVKSLKLKPEEGVLNNLEKDFEEIKSSFEHLKTINIEGVEPMYRIDETPTTFLREDVPSEGFTREQVLHNAPTHDGTYITMKRVVK